MFNTRHLLAIVLAIFIQSYVLFSQPTCSNFDTFTFGVIADCQCQNATCNSQFMLQDAVTYFNTNTDINFCAHLGDFWQTDYANLDIVQPIYESLNADHHYSIGNHEYDDNGLAGGLNQTSQMNLPSTLGMPDWYYDFSVFNWRFIIIESYELAPYSALAHPDKQVERDSLLALYPGPNHTGCLSQEQLDYIDTTIATAQTNDENVVLFAHHPVVNSNTNALIRNAQSLIDILESHDNVVAYMNGHTHASSHIEQNGIHYVSFNDMKISTPSTFSLIEVKYDTLGITGFGAENDYTLSFNSKIQILDNDNDGICDDVDMCPGIDDALIGTPCDDQNICTSGETYDSACMCTGGVFQDQDDDGVCDALDVCPAFDDNLIGTACDDEDVCTSGETYDMICECVGGVFQDQDDDGVCDALDVCPAFDDNLIGTPCDDLDICTSGETYNTACLCTGGVFQDQDGDGICDALDIPESNCGNIFFLTGNESFYHHRVTNKIYSTQTINGQQVNYSAPNSIELLNGFEVKIETVFHAIIEDCL